MLNKYWNNRYNMQPLDKFKSYTLGILNYHVRNKNTYIHVRNDKTNLRKPTKFESLDWWY